MSEYTEWETCANFYVDQFAFEDWLIIFDIEYWIEIPPTHPDFPAARPEMAATAQITSGKIGKHTFNRAAFIAMFGKGAVEAVENNVADRWREEER